MTETPVFLPDGSGEEDAPPPVQIAALQHYSYCPRQCALIHREQEFADNIHTARGNAVHEKVDIPESDIAKGVRVERALALYSLRSGLIGKADLVEFHNTGPYPVEYKHGGRREKKHDDIQLAAQALCLEEMCGVPVTAGAIYYHSSRRRREVTIDDKLRRAVVETAEAVRALSRSDTLPPGVQDKRCDNCSLYDICRPDALAKKEKIRAALHALYHPSDSEEA